jgi:hypothetical protein
MILSRPGSLEGNANSVFVSNNIVYVAGFDQNVQGDYVAMLWKDGVLQTLNTPGSEAYASSVFLYNYTVYVAGNGENAQGDWVALLWKNGEPQPLNTEGRFSEIYSVFVTTGN